MLLLRPTFQSVMKKDVHKSVISIVSTYKYYTQASQPTTQNRNATYSLNTTPLEFISNLARPNPSNIVKALSCTDDISSKSKLELNTTHIPFDVKTKASSGIVRSQDKNLKKLIEPFIQLSKPRLSALVVLSAICSYALTPYNATVLELIFLTVGTGLSSSSANAINMGREPEFDKLMVRTVSRPIVRGILTPEQAYKFAAFAGVTGVTTLYYGVNSTVAVLGGLNIVLYAWIYTSLKRRSILNTWVGAIVGAIPPLMGWAASTSLTHPAAWCLAGLLYAWQFPHFNALSHNIKNEYKAAGYVMTSFVNPKLNARVAFRYALLMFPLCFGLSYFGVTDWYFTVDSAVLNGWLSYWSGMFWMQQRKNYAKCTEPTVEGMKLANKYAKKVFWGSVWHLPGVLVLAMLHKKGRWDWLFGFDETLQLI